MCTNPKSRSGRLRSSGLLRTAERLVPKRRGRPPEADLRRAISTAYYALFHHLARTCAERLAGERAADAAVWDHVYRALEHGSVQNLDRESVQRLGPEIAAFIRAWEVTRRKRQQADYDPTSRHLKSHVVTDIREVADAMHRFDSASRQAQRAFAIYLLLKRRRRSG